MTATVVLTISVAMQCVAAALAFRLVRVTERKAAWLLIASALAMMAIRRAVVEYHLLSGDSAHTPDLMVELMGLAISTLMVVGVLKIAPLFRSARRAEELVREKEQKLKAANQQLDAQNQQLTAANQQLRATEQQLRATNQQLRATEQQARAVSAYSRSLIEASLDPMVAMDRDGRITDVNEATVRYTGVPRGTLIGSDFSQYFTEPEKAAAGCRQAFAEGFVRDYPLALRNADGQVRDVLYIASVYRDGAGNVQGVVAAARDITERKQAEAHLRIKNIAVASAIAGIAIAGIDGKIHYVNPAWLHMFACDWMPTYWAQPQRTTPGMPRMPTLSSGR